MKQEPSANSRVSGCIATSFSLMVLLPHFAAAYWRMYNQDPFGLAIVFALYLVIGLPGGIGCLVVSRRIVALPGKVWLIALGGVTVLTIAYGLVLIFHGR